MTPWSVKMLEDRMFLLSHTLCDFWWHSLDGKRGTKGLAVHIISKVHGNFDYCGTVPNCKVLLT